VYITRNALCIDRFCLSFERVEVLLNIPNFMAIQNKNDTVCGDINFDNQVKTNVLIILLHIDRHIVYVSSDGCYRVISASSYTDSTHWFTINPCYGKYSNVNS